MRKLINITKYLLPAIFIVFYLETTIFIHSHTIDNRVISHSHPYPTSQGHTHNAVELLSIAQMSVIASVAIFLFSALTASSILRSSIFSLEENINNFSVIPFAQLRAPPAV